MLVYNRENMIGWIKRLLQRSEIPKIERNRPIKFIQESTYVFRAVYADEKTGPK